jgi:serine/threonine-protein kinase ULK/ATG1
LVLLDDIFILLTLESMFPYTEETPVNFNVFNEQRKKSYADDPNTYKLMY